MRRLRDAIWFFGCGIGWAAMRDLFFYMRNTVEPEMFSKGHMSQWWIVVLSYWIADVAFVAFAAYITHGLLRIRPWRAIPLFQLVSDSAVLVLFYHLYLLASDRILEGSFASVGLDVLPYFFIAMMFVWLLVAIVRCRRFGEADDAEQRNNLVHKLRPGRRTSAFSKLSSRHFRTSPK
jgi:hypothetical protein